MTEEDRMRPRDWGLLALVMIVGAALRGVAIGQEALWSDEALTYVLAQAPASALVTAPLDPTAPLYYLLHKVLIIEGAGVVAGRSIAFVAGVLTITVVYFLGRTMAGRGGAALAAAWIAVSAPLIDYSQEARAYALLVLLIMVSALALHVAVSGPRRRRSWALAGFTLSLILALYTHLVALFWAAPALFILIFESEIARCKRAQQQAWLACAAIAIAAIPEMRRIVRYATENNVFHWLDQPDLAGLGRLVLEQWLPLGGLIGSTIAAASLILLAVWQRGALRAWIIRDRAGAMILAALLLQPLALWVFGFWVTPVIMARTMLPSLAGVGLVIAVLMAPLGTRSRAIGGTAIIGVLLAATLLGGTARPKEEWRAVRPILARADPARDLIIVCPYWKAPALMAATRDLRSAPLATGFDDHMRLLERHMGVEPRWEHLFYSRLFFTSNAGRLGIAPPADKRTIVPVHSLYLVMSDCSAVERTVIANWAKRFTISERWIAEGRPEHAATVIERWTLERPRSVELRLAR